MKVAKAAMIISACMLTLGLSVCSSDYMMHASDGRTTVTNGKPQADNNTDMISYKGAWSDRQQVSRSDVKQLSELNERGSKKAKGNTARCSATLDRYEQIG